MEFSSNGLNKFTEDAQHLGVEFLQNHEVMFLSVKHYYKH